MRPAAHFASALTGSRPARVVEVGVEEGRNAETMLDEWQSGDLFLVLVEIDPKHEFEIRARLSGRSNYQLVIGDSEKVAPLFPDDSFDLVYLDDDHSYLGITRSIAAWFPKVKPGGVLGGHDYMDREGDEVRKAVTELAERRGWQVHHAEWDWWVVRA